MPFPEILGTFSGIDAVRGLTCKHYIYFDNDEAIHTYFEESTGYPVRLVQEYVENGISSPLLTYDYFDVDTSPIDDNSIFQLPSPYSRDSCDRIIGGFPYIHVFHYFVRF